MFPCPYCNQWLEVFKPTRFFKNIEVPLQCPACGVYFDGAAMGNGEVIACSACGVYCHRVTTQGLCLDCYDVWKSNHCPHCLGWSEGGRPHRACLEDIRSYKADILRDRRMDGTEDL